MGEENGKSLGSWLLLGALVILVASVVLLSWVPPVSKDELVHHLAVPKLYLKHGGMVELPFMEFSYYPMNLDLLYLVALAFGNDILPKFIHFGFALLTAWLLFRYLRRRISGLYALFGVLLFLSLPLVVKLSITAYIDLGIIFFSAASLLFLLEWAEKGFKVKYLVLAAVFCGLGLGTKYNGLIALFLLTLFVPFLYARTCRDGKPGLLKPARQGLLFFVVSIALFSPWMVRNYHWTGNPLYPLYHQWFKAPALATGQAVSDQSQKEESRGGNGIFAYREIVYGEQGWEIMLLPVRLFFEGKDGDPRRFDGKLNPLLLLLPLFAFFRSAVDSAVVRREKEVFLAFAVLFFAFAFFSKDLRMRYIAPIIPPLVLLSVFGLRNMVGWIRSVSPKAGPWGSILLGAGLVFFMALNFRYLGSQFAQVDPFSYLSGKISRHEYIARFIPEYGAVRHINQHLPQEARVGLLFSGNRGYYMDRAYVYGEDLLLRSLKGAGRPERVLQGFRNAGVTHLLIQDRLFSRWADFNFNEDEKRALRDFFGEYAEGLFQADGFSVFALKTVPP
jgi:4-amino-4-deoxy-L-arabinose transferase-like glycosyltransferase